MFRIEINFAGDWSMLGHRVYPSQDAGEWKLAEWKQANQCYGDNCFRVVPVPAEDQWMYHDYDEDEIPW